MGQELLFDTLTLRLVSKPTVSFLLTQIIIPINHQHAGVNILGYIKKCESKTPEKRQLYEMQSQKQMDPAKRVPNCDSNMRTTSLVSAV